MKVAVDVSSLLSFELMGILDDAVSIAELYTTSIVEEELKEIAGFNDEKSRIAKKILKLIQDGKLRCFDIKNPPHSKYIASNIFLTLCLKEKIPFLITDDADTAYYLGRMATAKGIKVRTCAALLIELVKSKKISRSEAKGKLKELITKRSWEGGIIEILIKRYLEDNIIL